MKTTIALLGLVVSTGACATGSATMDPTSLQMTEALVAVKNDDFADARGRLSSLASSCPRTEISRRAALLLITAELDTGNPESSPHRAATLAEGFLRLPDATPEELLLVRSLYRLAVHLDTLSPRSASDDDTTLAYLEVGEGCSSPDPSESDQLGEPAAPWLLSLDSRLRASQHRIAELEAEMSRITELLTSGAPSEDVGR